MARTRHLALVAGTMVLALSVGACTSSKQPAASTDGTAGSSTTTTVVGAGPAVRVPANDPASLGRLFAAWAIPQGSDGYVGTCAPDPASMASADTWCSVETTGAAGGQVFRMFHPGDTAASAAVLIAPVDGFYRIDDSFTFGDGTPPSWAPATAS
jgi:hypothetical protein